VESPFHFRITGAVGATDVVLYDSECQDRGRWKLAVRTFRPASWGAGYVQMEIPARAPIIVTIARPWRAGTFQVWLNSTGGAIWPTNVAGR